MPEYRYYGITTKPQYRHYDKSKPLKKNLRRLAYYYLYPAD